MLNLNIFVALAAGFVSFASPCILPIVPGFFSYLAGVSSADASQKRFTIFFQSVWFVLGFSLVFSLLGVLLNTVLTSIGSVVQEWLARIGGVIIILFGLVLTGLLKIPALEGTHTLKIKQFSSRSLTSFLFGAAFAAGWTPCVGAVLGGILGLAATQPGSSFVLLFAYTIGLGIPFLLVGFFSAWAQPFILRHSAHLAIISKVFGFLLIVIGILAFTQELNLLANVGLLNQLLLSQ